MKAFVLLGLTLIATAAVAGSSLSMNDWASQCPTSRRPAKCSRLVRQLTKLTEPPVCPVCPELPPPCETCPQPNLVARVFTKDFVSVISGYFPTAGPCSERRFSGTSPANDNHVSISGDCTGTLTVDWGMDALSAVEPTVSHVGGTLTCSCCGDVAVDFAYKPDFARILFAEPHVIP